MKKPFFFLAHRSVFLIFLALPFSDARMEWGGVPLYVPEMAILFSMFCFVIAVRRRECSLRVVPKRVGIGFLLVFLGMIVSAYSTGAFTEPAFGAMKSWVVFPAISAFLFFQVLRSERDIREALFVWFLVSATVSVSTLFPGSVSAQTYDGRLLSVFPSPNHLALFLLPGSVIGWLFVSGIGNLPRHFLALLFEGIIIFTLFRTESHGAIAASFLGTVIFFFGALFGWRAVIRTSLGFLVIAMGLFVSLHLSGEWARMSGGMERHSFASRIMIWNAAGSMIAENPILGVGPRNFQEAYLRRQTAFPPYLEWAVPHPHNVFLSFWLFSGLFGLLGFFLLLFSIFSGTKEGLMRRGVTGRSVPATLFSLGTAIMVAGLVDETYFKTDLAVGFWILIAFTAFLISKKRHRGNVSVTSMRTE